jgi:uroporphyrinogen decarboxylase
MIDQFNDVKPDVLSLDWRISINQAEKILNPEIGIQGNLDPYIAEYNGEAAIQETRSILNQTAGINNYVFNFGHGVLPETSPATLREIVEIVHNHNFH